ncbi:DUF305 domain-containing protein [Nonomuraea diastatica]|uniref:DUF305 domain-containing protein n=2 Tax=Nonomuraea diastatica TaxID=1848329 RepID=A0A4R4WAU9_9ACTN|nr:DUF305 domain-containing protein [Nonomuraea diastatica]
MATVVTLTSCSSSTSPQAPRADSTAPVIAPGRPGEQERTLSPAEAATAVPSPTPNAADVTYVQDMIVHHRQALDMALLAPNRAESPKVKGLADRIKAAQAPEIQYMTTWLREQEQKVPDHHAAHDGMPGMATPEQMEALRAATGKDFDRMFLQLMINHHQGAITMSEKVLSSGSHIRIEELASDVSVTQLAEIRRMREMQTAL